MVKLDLTQIISAESWFPNKFGSSSLDLQISIENFVKGLCNTNIHLSNSGGDNSLKAFTASRLIPLNKIPGIHPIGSMRYWQKINHVHSKRDIKDSAGSLQVHKGQKAGSNAAVPKIYDVYQQDEPKDVLLVDAENASNSINRKVMLHNMSILAF